MNVESRCVYCNDFVCNLVMVAVTMLFGGRVRGWPRRGLCSLTQGYVKKHAQLGADEYANHIPNPKHIPKYTQAKVPHTQDKHTARSSFSELSCCPIISLADANPLEYVTTYSLPLDNPIPG